MELFNAILPQLLEILTTLLVTLAGYLGLLLKNWLIRKTQLAQQEINREQWIMLENIMKHAVQFVEQTARELKPKEKYDMAVQAIVTIASQKGLELTEEQMKVVTESFVNQFYPHIEEVVKENTDGIYPEMVEGVK